MSFNFFCHQHILCVRLLKGTIEGDDVFGDVILLSLDMQLEKKKKAAVVVPCIQG